jgi:hypothetical protein
VKEEEEEIHPQGVAELPPPVKEKKNVKEEEQWRNTTTQTNTKEFAVEK